MVLDMKIFFSVSRYVKLLNFGMFYILDSRADGDWTCPDCGNVNFGFRTVCNRAKCGAPRPPFFPAVSSSSDVFLFNVLCNAPF